MEKNTDVDSISVLINKIDNFLDNIGPPLDKLSTNNIGDFLMNNIYKYTTKALFFLTENAFSSVQLISA